MRRVVSAARLSPLVVLALGLPCFAGTAAGQMAAFVNGTMLDADGKPVDGARIVFRFEGGISSEQEIRTDRKGSYVQVGLAPGPYTVWAEKEYEVLPSDANFFMVGIRRNVQEVGQEFSKRSILVGRPFPPMTEHLRVSVGTQDEMNRFMAAFKEIFPAGTISAAARQ